MSIYLTHILKSISIHFIKISNKSNVKLRGRKIRKTRNPTERFTDFKTVRKTSQNVPEPKMMHSSVFIYLTSHLKPINIPFIIKQKPPACVCPIQLGIS